MGFHTINPCGYAWLEMVRMMDLMQDYPKFTKLSADVIENFQNSGYFNDVQVIQY